jgi:hypothetical protein
MFVVYSLVHTNYLLFSSFNLLMYLEGGELKEYIKCLLAVNITNILMIFHTFKASTTWNNTFYSIYCRHTSPLANCHFNHCIAEPESKRLIAVINYKKIRYFHQHFLLNFVKCAPNLPPPINPWQPCCLSPRYLHDLWPAKAIKASKQHHHHLFNV